MVWPHLRDGCIYSLFPCIPACMYSYVFIVSLLVIVTISPRQTSCHYLSCDSISEVDLSFCCFFLWFNTACIHMDFFVSLYSSCMISYSQAEAAMVRMFSLHPFEFFVPLHQPGLWLLLLWKKCKARCDLILRIICDRWAKFTAFSVELKHAVGSTMWKVWYLLNCCFNKDGE